MIVELKRTSRYNSKPDPIAYEEERWQLAHCTCKTLEAVRQHTYAREWFFREGTRNHREERGHTVMERLGKVWLADIPSIEWAIERWGELVVGPSEVVGIDLSVEIYDGYRE